MKPKKNPKPFVVYMWTWRERGKRRVEVDLDYDRKMAVDAQRSACKYHLNVSDLVRVELPRPVKAKR